MDRMTKRNKAGESLPVKHLNIRPEDTTSEDTLTEILEKLAAYEDICPTPEKLAEIDKMYLEKCEEANRLKRQLENRGTGDLISRKVVLELMWDLLEISEYDGDKIIAVKDDIENLSAAYDVNKAVERMKQAKYNEHDAACDNELFQTNCGIDTCIEILKGGGVDEKGVL